MSWILILGAKSDIARSCAHTFAAHGFSVILAGRNAKEMEPDASDLAIRYQVETRILELDITAVKTHKKIYESLPEPPEIVLSVVGYLGDAEQARHDITEADRIFHVNFIGPAHFLSLAADDMEKRKSGTIIGIGSVAGDRGRQSNYVYGSAKAGFAAFLSGLRHRLYKSGVHVMTVKPGFVATKMTAGMDLPEKLTASPDQVARDIYRAYTKKTNILYTIWIWRWIMLIIKHLPEPIFKKTSM